MELTNYEYRERHLGRGSVQGKLPRHQEARCSTSSSSMLCRASEVFGHCERPHLLFDKDGFTPIALTNGVKIQGLSNDDQSFTLLRPLQR